MTAPAKGTRLFHKSRTQASSRTYENKMAQYAFPSNFGAIFGKIGKAIMGSESSVKIKTFSFV